MELGNTLGERIRLLRERKGWNQTQLWRALDMEQSRLSKLERGVNNP